MRWSAVLLSEATVVDHTGPKDTEVFANPTSVMEMMKTLRADQRRYGYFRAFVSDTTLYFWDATGPTLHEEMVAHLPAGAAMLPVNLDVTPPRTIVVSVSRFAVARTRYAGQTPDELDEVLTRLLKANPGLRAMQATLRAHATSAA